MTSIVIVRPNVSVSIGPRDGDEPRAVTVSRSPQTLTVKRDGLRGPAGDQGPQGPPGPAGSDAVSDPGDLTLFFNNALI